MRACSQLCVVVLILSLVLGIKDIDIWIPIDDSVSILVEKQEEDELDATFYLA